MNKIGDEKIIVIMPVFNEAKIIKQVIEEIKSSGFKTIIVVDDGSTDETCEILEKNNILYISHSINRGKGAAMKTGIEAAKIMGAEKIVSIDGDGQHNPEDINKMISKIQEGYDVVLGTRMKNHKGMPLHKVIANYLGNFFTWVIYGLWVTDSQSGFRMYSKKATEKIDTKTDRYTYDSEIIREIKINKLKFVEVPIEVRYTEYSKNKMMKQGFLNGIKTLFKMIITE
ncbi:glycosyltransferase family 2 protein [candidate division WS5 bacterium]|uniref:Glycosyltransferase family 2 protein n=1 Tax=candidate division WS5 bacterium TaxID=2093353 RepID=A0A419DGH1_9BACT|nr:MAG: glycosyltransferase family 2 protein [candidate division WS5 bacterium]